MEEEIINRVAQSQLLTINLEDLYEPDDRIVYDLKDNLFEGIILKEKDFRHFLKSNDWTVYQDKHVAIFCSIDAIIPTWAYMLLAVNIEPYAKTIVYGDLSVLEDELFKQAYDRLPHQECRQKPDLTAL